MTRFMPLRAGTYNLSSRFGPRGSGMHWGLDFAAQDGTSRSSATTGDSSGHHLHFEVNPTVWAPRSQQGPRTVAWECPGTGSTRCRCRASTGTRPGVNACRPGLMRSPLLLWSRQSP
jgi:murein DD-endopeptidase MepM/ murein hydrolase activator NlpD